MQRLLTLLGFILLCAPGLRAQEPCAADAANAALMARDPAFAARVARMKKDWAAYAEMKAAQRLLINGADTVYEIPVVVHIIHTGGAIGSAYNPTDAQIQAAIDYTNQTYAATWPGYPGVANGGTRVPFQFVLAKRDPYCQPTTGILRVNGSGLPNYLSGGIEGAGATDVSVKNLSRWPNDQYYNIWVVWGIGNGAAGYAYYPGAGPAVDGTVILASYMQAGTSTLTHELGHAMSLPHTFEGDNNGASCPPNANCATDGDGICDTEPHQRGMACNATTNPCTSAPPGITNHSFLSYSGCRDRFTPGQRDKMIFGLKNGRAALMNSIAGLPPLPTPTAGTCVPAHSNSASLLDAGPHAVTFNTINRLSAGFTGEGKVAWLADFCNGRTDVFAGGTYTISVKSGPQAERVAVYLDYNNDGVFQVPAELVFSSVGNVANQTHTGSISIPATGSPLCVPLRMRVVSDVLSGPVPSPCGTLAHGQAEDYAVTIKAANPATLSIATPTNPSCYHDTVVFTAATAGVPASSPVRWSLNGVFTTSGTTYSLTNPQPGDVVRAYTIAPNPVCALADTIRATAITVVRTPSTSTPPVISYINGLLVSPVAPVQWFYNGVAIPGATGATLQPSLPGNYYAAARTLPCWSTASNILNVSLLDIGKGPAQGAVRMYPNPAHEAVTLEWSGPLEGTLMLHNAVGQAVLEQPVHRATIATFSVRGLPAGVYFLKVKEESGALTTARLVVQ